MDCEEEVMDESGDDESIVSGNSSNDGSIST
jgi:hypothetical protein